MCGNFVCSGCKTPVDLQMLLRRRKSICKCSEFVEAEKSFNEFLENGFFEFKMFKNQFHFDVEMELIGDSIKYVPMTDKEFELAFK